MRTQDFETKNLGERHDFYSQDYTLMLANLFENFRNMYLKIYKLDPEKFLSAPGLAQKAALKKTKVNLEWIRNLKQTLNHGLVLKKSHKVITFNQNAGLTPYIDMNANLKRSKK